MSLIEIIVGLALAGFILKGVVGWYKDGRDAGDKPSVIRGLITVFVVLALIAGLFYLIFIQAINLILKLLLIFMAVVLFGWFVSFVFKKPRQKTEE
jgi:hypothetical protein